MDSEIDIRNNLKSVRPTTNKKTKFAEDWNPKIKDAFMIIDGNIEIDRKNKDEKIQKIASSMRIFDFLIFDITNINPDKDTKKRNTRNSKDMIYFSSKRLNE